MDVRPRLTQRNHRSRCRGRPGRRHLLPILLLQQQLVGGVAKALEHLDDGVLAPVGPHRQEVRIEGGADGDLLGAAGCSVAGAGSLPTDCGLLALLAIPCRDELVEAPLGVQAAEVEDVLHAQGDDT
eukprot:9538194-Heterocapsa_arctica.AAC.1